jgi:hypothetical protein
MRHPDRFRSVAGFANYFEIRMHRKQCAQAFTKQWLVIDQKNPD